MWKRHNDPNAPNKYFCSGTRLEGSIWVNKQRDTVFFEKFDLKSVWAKAWKWSILGSSKFTRNPISTSWSFCSTDWWTSEFRHFCIWNYQQLNKRSYYTFKNNYDSPKPIRFGPYHTEIRLNVYWKHTLETLPFGNIILFWKQIFIILERSTEYWKKCRLETKSL